MNAEVRFHGEPPTHLTFPALETLGLRHISTTRYCPEIASAAEPVAPVGRKAAALFQPQGLDPGRVTFLRQVHGATVCRVDGAQRGCAGEGDTLLTRSPGLSLAVFTADCLAVILFDPAGQRLALSHVGWRGTVRSASRVAAEALVSEGARPADLVAAMFPSIGPCCYEVDRPVIESLSSAFPDRWEEWVRSSGPQTWRLDLWTANESQLREAGLAADRILNPRLCTACRPDLFFSYRKEGSGGRLVTVAALPPTQWVGFRTFVGERPSGALYSSQVATMARGLKTRLDYQDYCAIPPDGKRYELIDGEVHVTPAPSPLHQRISKRLQRFLEEYFEGPGRGEVFNAPIDVILTPHDVVQPDLVVVANPTQVSNRGIEGAPLLVVEILSPTTTVYDRTTKAQRYAALGIPHYWIVDPETRTLEYFRRHEAAYQLVGAFGPDATLTHPDFPGLSLDLPALWR